MLQPGVYFLYQYTSINSVKRLFSGILAHYRTYSLNDIHIYYHTGCALILVIPLVCITLIVFGTVWLIIHYIIQLQQQLRFELKQDLCTCDGKHNLVDSINLILSYYTRDVRRELPQREVTLPFLQSFPFELRLIGKYSPWTIVQ